MHNRSNSSLQAPGDDNDDGDSDSDRENDEKMMSILLRIKQTKEALEESRIKKGAFIAVKEVETKLQKEIKSDIMRFHGKWTKKIRGVVAQIQALKLKSQDIEERNSAFRRQRKLDVNQKEKEMRIISDQLQSIAEQFKMTGNTQVDIYIHVSIFSDDCSASCIVFTIHDDILLLTHDVQTANWQTCPV